LQSLTLPNLAHALAPYMGGREAAPQTVQGGVAGGVAASVLGSLFGNNR